MHANIICSRFLFCLTRKLVAFCCPLQQEIKSSMLLKCSVKPNPCNNSQLSNGAVMSPEKGVNNVTVCQQWRTTTSKYAQENTI